MNFTTAFGGSNGNGKPPEGIGGFDAAEPAPEYTPLPVGVYIARVLRGEFTSTKAGDDAYKLKFEVTEGPQAGKPITWTRTFGAKAISYSKRDLARSG